jgi:aryl-alcohol dehydrogenase-like predicted oxidoreductase
MSGSLTPANADGSRGPHFYLGTGHLPASVAHPVLDAYFEAGGRYLDTARVYDDNEAIIGEWLRTRGVAAEMHLLTKGGHPDLANWVPRLSEQEVEADAQQSLAALGVARVDAYLLHRDDPATPIADVAATLRELVGRGVTRTIGVSNWSAERLGDLAGELERAGGPRLDYVSNYFGLARVGAGFIPGAQGTSAELLEMAQRLGIRLLAWMPRAHGYFGGASDPRLKAFDTTESRRRRNLLHEVAAEHGVEPGALLTRWLLTIHPVITPVFSTTRTDGVRELFRDGADTDLDAAAHELSDRVGPGWADAGQFSS